MNKQFLSAFALSLILLSGHVCAQTEGVDDFLGLETEILPELQGKQKFTSPQMHQSESWNVPVETALVDKSEPNKGQKFSIIPWEELDSEEWLSISKWINEREVKDRIPDWKIRLREATHHELIGKVLNCHGTCYVFRGTNKARVQHLSQVREGDEFQTEPDSVAWIFLMDGSLVRLSSETSISFHEINFSATQNFIEARLNHGHIYWHNRSKIEDTIEYAPETDSVSLPLMLSEANQEYFHRKSFQKLNDSEQISELMIPDDFAVKDQFEFFKKLKSQNTPYLTIPTKVMIVAPNGTIVSQDTSFDLVHLMGGASWFKKRTATEGHDFKIYLRGYSATEAQTDAQIDWYEIPANGRSYAVTDSRGTLQILELLTKRITTIELAREIWIRDFTLPIIQNFASPEILGRQYGYRLWGDDLEKRYNFLLEYTRRVETTNLKSVETLLIKLEENGEKPRKELSDNLFRVSLNHYLLGLKSRYDKKKMRVREMNDLQYYVWMLKHGKW
jgi:hypothetical protein